jgi:hypothetical protein
MKLIFGVPQPFDPEKEKDRVNMLRGIVGNFKDYKIFISSDVDDAKAVRSRQELFNSIEELCDEMGHKAFFPHKFVGFQGEKKALGPRDTYVLINELMIPNCDLFLGYLGIDSYAVGSMAAQAMLKRKDIIYFYEKGLKLESVRDVLANISGGIHQEADQEILVSPRVFYHRDKLSQPLFPYPHIKGVVQFTEVKDCVYKLREKIEEYFS